VNRKLPHVFISILLTVAARLIAGPNPYEAIDRHALSAPGWAEQTVAGLARYLVRPARTDGEKARAIFRWIAENIAYDTQSYASGRIPETDSEDVFRSRIALCGGYAGLFKSLAEEAGLKAEIINGFAKGVEYKIGRHFRGDANHAWNAVRLDGSWRLIDATWGAGHADESGRYVRELDEHFFLTPPDEMIFTHFPEAPAWQLLAHPIPLETFEKQAYVKSPFFKYGLKLKSHGLGFIDVQSSLAVVLATPTGVRLSTQLIRGQRIWDESLTFIQRRPKEQVVNAVFPSPGTYTLRLFAKEKDDPGPYEWAVDYLVHAIAPTGGAVGFPEAYQPFDQLDCTLVAPMEGRLKAGRNHGFSIRIPGAEKAVLVMGQQWVTLGKNGDLFQCTAMVARGDVQIAVQFPGDGAKYSVVLKYVGY
jgi:hypothetical protein